MTPPTADTTGMNPQRAVMLREIAAGGTDRSLSPSDANEPKKGPLASGSNIVQLGRAASKDGDPSEQERPSRPLPTPAAGHPDRDGRSRLDLFPSLRPGGLRVEDAAQARAANRRHEALVADRWRARLCDLLNDRPFRLVLQPSDNKQRASAAEIYPLKVTDVGLAINDFVDRCTNVPVLPMPLPKDLTTSTLAFDGGFNRVAQGFLLETIWPHLLPAERRDIVRQLRRLVEQMRKTAQNACHDGQRRLGSVFAGTQSLVIDRCCGITHWDIRSNPKSNDFIDFLAATLDPSAPANVIASTTAQLQQHGRLVFSHGELGLSNIVVKNGIISAIIGWDGAGWYPEWWEYVKFFEAPSRFRDWYSYANDIFGQTFEAELVAYNAVVRLRRP